MEYFMKRDKTKEGRHLSCEKIWLTHFLCELLLGVEEERERKREKKKKRASKSDDLKLDQYLCITPSNLVSLKSDFLIRFANQCCITFRRSLSLLYLLVFCSVLSFCYCYIVHRVKAANTVTTMPMHDKTLIKPTSTSIWVQLSHQRRRRKGRSSFREKSQKRTLSLQRNAKVNQTSYPCSPL